ncbi:Thioesterase superfamily protein [Thalictrum thalictroides]|uniref:Acyl-coenzyme A thioesterase 13 n=1 Tax=Thalictrum thalictroides TaxID=46969 RepID=A0A7J6WDD0_THATH|nr:Thioesterase superfamily protein [Thalictrum thalictroides]
MEKAKELLLELIQEEERQQTQSCVLNTNQHSGHGQQSFYEEFALKGIRVDRIESGCVVCTFVVPRRLTNATGNLCSGAIANIIDEVGGAVVHVDGLPMNVSVDMSISYLSTAKVNDELEIISRVLGKKGGYSGTIVLLRNKATGEVIAEGRHSLFGKLPSKI